MYVRQKVLEFLENNRGKYISGEEIAKELDISRNSIWKTIKNLKEEGYEITAITNKGYCLAENNEIISPESIEKYLDDKTRNFKIEIIKETTSTNKVLKEKAIAGEKDGYVVIANKQTGGYGRYGRAFFSPDMTGIYMSILLRPQIKARDALLITTAAAVATASALHDICDGKFDIKWVNDIYKDGKKVCGILTEAATDIESGRLQYAILGIGINLVFPKEGFPSDIEDIATAVYDKETQISDKKSMLIAQILKNFYRYYENLENREFLDEYRKRCFFINKKLKITRNGEEETVTAIGIDNDFRLIIRNKDNTISELSSGEIQIVKS